MDLVQIETLSSTCSRCDSIDDVKEVKVYRSNFWKLELLCIGHRMKFAFQILCNTRCEI